MHAAYLTALLGAAIAAAAPSLESRAAPTPQTVKVLKISSSLFPTDLSPCPDINSSMTFVESPA